MDSKKSRFRLFDENFKKRKAHYLLQCGMATAAVMIILLTVDTMFKEVMMASFGATSFLIFAMPHIRTSRVRSVLGGYLIGSAIGITLHHFAVVMQQQMPGSHINSIFGGIAVGLSLLLMTMTNTEHPPAAGLALGLVLQGYEPLAVVTIIVSVAVLLLIKYMLRNWLINLY